MFDYSDIYWMYAENDLLENSERRKMYTHTDLRGVEQVCSELRDNSGNEGQTL